MLNLQILKKMPLIADTDKVILDILGVLGNYSLFLVLSGF